jgi:hypothetical protein
VHRAPRRAARALLALLFLSVAGAALPEPPAGPLPCPGVFGRAHPLPLRALDLAFVGPDRLVVLDAAEIALFTLGDKGLTLLSRRPLPGPFEVVRMPGAVLQASEPDGAVWAITSRSPRAVLFGIEGPLLVERDQAEALPFPGCPRGLRFRTGTNLIEGEVEGVGHGPFLDVAAAEPLAAVTPDGRLVRSATADAPAGIRIGPTLAPLWPGWLAASTPAPPDRDDAVLVLSPPAGTPAAACPTPGPVRAIAARPRGDVVRLAVAMDDGDAARSSVSWLDLTRPRP